MSSQREGRKEGAGGVGRERKSVQKKKNNNNRKKKAGGREKKGVG